MKWTCLTGAPLLRGRHRRAGHPSLATATQPQVSDSIMTVITLGHCNVRWASIVPVAFTEEEGERTLLCSPLSNSSAASHPVLGLLSSFASASRGSGLSRYGGNTMESVGGKDAMSTRHPENLPREIERAYGADLQSRNRSTRRRLGFH